MESKHYVQNNSYYTGTRFSFFLQYDKYDCVTESKFFFFQSRHDEKSSAMWYFVESCVKKVTDSLIYRLYNGKFESTRCDMIRGHYSRGMSVITDRPKGGEQWLNEGCNILSVDGRCEPHGRAVHTTTSMVNFDDDPSWVPQISP